MDTSTIHQYKCDCGYCVDLRDEKIAARLVGHHLAENGCGVHSITHRVDEEEQPLTDWECRLWTEDGVEEVE